eukprot:jgi/Antlo1/1403/421
MCPVCHVRKVFFVQNRANKYFFIDISLHYKFVSIVLKDIELVCLVCEIQCVICWKPLADQFLGKLKLYCGWRVFCRRVYNNFTDCLLAGKLGYFFSKKQWEFHKPHRYSTLVCFYFHRGATFCLMINHK